ncbi:response regulator transcription factor [Clostridium luticellarii]|jgi:YesN/AraC family two-component response regulator|uniref:Stage 0 sporulation protein A homolog n=1 Tax=Clostridium luticellarii TaxID=1691940 RepID=A0A2T0BMZ5_9CLOT|nr:response regulator [Clostridium luticellarii]PRR85258.1 putative response regulatory protein [Clostridium luticellarii]
MYKLLIAEDEPLERKALRIILQKHFYNIDLLEDCKNGCETVLSAKIYRPNIILMDIRMPKKNGLEAQREIIDFLPNVKTIILTAYEKFDYAKEAIEYGVSNYILKPVRPNDLKCAVTKALNSIEKFDSSNTGNNISRSSFNNNSNPSEDTIKSILKYIDNNFSSQINLTSAANFVHLNPQYLSRYFKQKTGVTFIQYVTRLRLEKAKKLLITTDKSITQVALEAGYLDVAYFSKVFLKNEKLSPHKFKMKNSNKI